LTMLLEQTTAGAQVTRTRAKSRLPGADAKPTVKGTATRKGPKAYLEELFEDDFFKKPRTIAEVKAELANRGHHIALTSLSKPLQTLTQERQLRRQKAATNGKGTRTYAYSNW